MMVFFFGRVNVRVTNALTYPRFVVKIFQSTIVLSKALEFKF
jgi:hypothetical protein